MKILYKITLSIFFILLCINIEAQYSGPRGITFQGIATDQSGALYTGDSVSVTSSIKNSIGSTIGVDTYVESFVVHPNEGVFTIIIGQGNAKFGNFNSINWANGPYFLNLKVSLKQGNIWTPSYDMGTQQFWAVPYALFASSIPNVLDSLNFINDIKVNGLTVGKGGGKISTNTAFGNLALNSNIKGFQNSAIGVQSLLTNKVGSQNTAVGFGADVTRDSLTNATAIGSGAKVAGSNSIQLGNSAVTSVNTSGIISASGFKIPGGTSNQLLLANGGTITPSLKFDTLFNVAIASDSALRSNKTGRYNVAIGYNTLKSLDTGYYNVSIGASALESNKNGFQNNAIGINALTWNTSGFGNNAIGTGALQENTIGNMNSALGNAALYYNTTGNGNSAVGRMALFNNTIGFQNSAIGVQSLLTNKVGSQNTAVGFGADVTRDSLTNATAIGSGAKVAGSNSIQLGNSAVTSVNTSGIIKASGLGLGNNVTPDSSAIIDASSNTKGFLPPRMTYVQRNNIKNPAIGLIIYCYDCISSPSNTIGEPEYYNGKTWMSFYGSIAYMSISKLPSTISIIGNQIYTYNGQQQGPNTVTKTGSNGNISFFYSGIAPTIYATSSIRPIQVGIYQVSAILASDSLYSEASTTSVFSITSATSVVAPTVGTIVVSNVTSNGATSGVNIISNGGGKITAKGIVWSTSTSPTILLTSKTVDTSASSTFISNITGLQLNTKYYVRAYATNSAGTSYGPELTFTTSATSVVAPTVGTIAVSNVTSNGATSGVNIISNGGGKITAKGIVWSTSTSPTILLTSKTVDTSASSTFISNITGLQLNTKYYVRAYATNSAGTSYGPELTFTTSATSVVAPTVGTIVVSNVTSNGATSGVNIISNGGGKITAKGIVWSTSTSPTILLTSKTVDTSASSTFISNITGLQLNTKYYVRAYATNSAGTSYGPELTFTTSATSVVAPTVGTIVVSNVTSNGATSGVNIISNGGGKITAKGIVWSTSTSPTILLTSKTVDTSASSTFISNITGLQLNTKYYVRAYATNSAGTSYGPELTFTTSATSVVAPTVGTIAVSNVTSNGATSGVNIISNGGGKITAKGIVWSTSTSPTILLTSKTVDTSASSTFISNITGLQLNTKYYVRAYATNSAGTSYGPELTFTTSATSVVAPTVGTIAVSNVTSNGATSGVNIISNGGGKITAKGIVWSTSTSPTILLTSKTVDTSASSTFISNITGLQLNTKYYVRAYATNSAGTSYGPELTFTTSATSVVAPTVGTIVVSNVTSNGATSGVNIISNGGGKITAKGIVWSTSTSPTILLTSKTVDTSASSTFISNITGLQLNTKYYVRAYATNSAGTSYGPELTFTTSATSVVAPTVGTIAVSNVTSNGATSGVNIISNGGGKITAKGIVWSTSTSPTILLTSKTVDTSASSTFISNITGLQLNTKYYVRAYATNSAGTSYGPELTFTTSATSVVAPTVGTIEVSNIGWTGATSGVLIKSEGDGNVTAKGIVWSTSTSPTIVLTSKTVATSPEWKVALYITFLQPNTRYYVRAYATNSAGTSYGPELTFMTRAIEAPVVWTDEVSNISSTSATSGGNIISMGGENIKAKGIVWSTSTSPTILLTSKTVDTSASMYFTSKITGLQPNTKYYVRAYATNSAGTSYGPELTFTTSATSVVAPTVGTIVVSNVTSNGATSGVNIISNGGGKITAKGIVWSTSTSPTILLTSKTVDTSASSTFISNITGLQLNTKYYVRAYATNSAGTSYGPELTFTTSATSVVAPTVGTIVVSNVTSNGATSGVNIISNGGGKITAKGIVWSTSTSPTILLTSKTVDTSASSTFISNITGLQLNTKYYVRAYATNSAGTSYGPELTFTTSATSVVAPTVGTIVVSNVTSNGATSGVNIISNGGGKITAKGIVWSTSTSPTILLTSKTVDTSASSTFISNITGLQLNTKYYVRAYATNSAGTSYGPELTFTTSATSVVAPTVGTIVVSNVTSNGATSGVNIISNGGGKITAKGIVWSTSTSPTILLTSKTVDTSASSTFISNITGLVPNTKYYVRAYATNSAGTSYGAELTFTTDKANSTITVTGASAYTYNGSSQGPNTSTKTGSTGAVTYKYTGTGTTVYGPSATAPIMAGSYQVIASIVADANFNGSSSSPFAFKINPILASITSTTIVSNISGTKASSGGIIGSTGGDKIIAKGVVWSTSTSPTILLTSKTVDTGSSSTFISNITGLIPNTKYYVRAYATNSAGTSYGPELTFTTTSIAIGDTYQGGTIFYILQPSDKGYKSNEIHGLIFAEDFIGKAQFYSKFSNNSATVVGAYGKAVGDGKLNTSMILARGFDGFSAASVANSYYGGGFKDWFLPSAEELKLLSINQNWINSWYNKNKDFLINSGKGLIWTSSEDSNNVSSSYAINFLNDPKNPTLVTWMKQGEAVVIPVRSF